MACELTSRLRGAAPPLGTCFSGPAGTPPEGGALRSLDDTRAVPQNLRLRTRTWHWELQRPCLAGGLLLLLLLRLQARRPGRTGPTSRRPGPRRRLPMARTPRRPGQSAPPRHASRRPPVTRERACAPGHRRELAERPCRRLSRPPQCNGARPPWRYRDDRALRAGSRRDRQGAGRARRRQGRAPGGAFADRRHSRAGWLLRDDGRLPADHDNSALDRRSARSAVAPRPGGPGGDSHAQRGDPPDPRRDRHP